MFSLAGRASSRRVSRPMASRLAVRSEVQSVSKRHLSLHEYQSAYLMRSYGIRVPQGSVAVTPHEAQTIAYALDTDDVVIKAQILAGGRGKGTFTNGFKGGVHLADSPENAEEIASKMLNQTLVTAQTGPSGRLVNKVLVAKRFFTRREAYFSIVLDREHNAPIMVGSPQGGVDIEKVAKETPDLIFKKIIDFDLGLQEEDAMEMARNLGFPDRIVPETAKQILKLYTLFMEKDALMVEINPLVETSEGKPMFLDAKFHFDDNAAFRHKDLFAQEDNSQRDAREVHARDMDLNYISLDGNIGCLVNGAGLAMATMDAINLKGGSPANFLDVGGGATKEQVKSAIEIISSDPKVKVILINIFGGIMRCDVIALGLINAVTELQLGIPLVVRLQGTNVEEAHALLESSGLRLMVADDLELASEKAVKVAQIKALAEAAELDINFEIPI